MEKAKPTSGDGAMEVQGAQPPSGSSPAAYPPWVMLEQYCNEIVEDPSCSTADDKTLAVSRTTTGHPICISLRLAAPPATSRVCIQLPDGVRLKYAIVLAANGDSLLILADLEQGYNNCTTDHFVYNAGAAAADPPRLPLLSLLPPYYLTEEEKNNCLRRPRGPVHRYLDTDATGLLRRGEDEIVVAELKMVAVSKDTPEQKAAELFMLRSGEWSVKRPRISCGGDHEVGDLPSWWSTDKVVPVGDRLLCWVDLARAVMFCDVFKESPGLRYVPLPTDPCAGRASKRDVCVTDASGGALKFVNIFPRCCCGGVGATLCERSHHAYIIRTWTMRMDDMAWVMDGMVDATELWAGDAYGDLPRIPLDHPIVGMDEPHAICFMLCEAHHVKRGDATLWLVMVNTRSKTVQSVTCYPGGRWQMAGDTLIPSKISYFLNSYPSGSSDDGTLMAKSQMAIELPQVVGNDEQLRNDAGNSMLQSSSKSSAEPAMLASEILTALQEIPSYGLALDDMLKAYSILSHDSGHRFRSLLRLPISLRKDWLLMEIKVNEG